MSDPQKPIVVELGDYIEVDGRLFRLRSLTLALNKLPELEFKHVVFEMQHENFNINPVTCMEHELVQHRDAKPPWCDNCGRDAANNVIGVKIR